MSDARKTVLYADDVRRWRLFVEDLLEDDYDVVLCEDCPSALARIAEGGVDLVILDHLMAGDPPLNTGLDVCVHLKGEHPRLPIIIYTGAWRDGKDVDRTRLEMSAKAPVVFKEVRDRGLDDLKARVRALLA